MLPNLVNFLCTFWFNCVSYLFYLLIFCLFQLHINLVGAKLKNIIKLLPRMLYRGIVAKIEPDGSFTLQEGQTTHTFQAHLFSTADQCKIHVGNKIFIELPSNNLKYIPVRNPSIEYDPYTMLVDLTKEKYSSVCAVLIKAYPPIKSKGTDYLFTLLIGDESAVIELKIFVSSPKSAYQMIIGMPSKTEIEFEELYNPGDIFMIPNIKLAPRTGVALLHKSVQLCKIGNANGNTLCKTKTTNKLAYQVVKYFSISYTKIVEKRKKKKVKLKIEELTEGRYFNIIAKLLYTEIGIPTILCVSDFTNNKRMPDLKRGKYKLGMLLYIKAYGEHATKVQKLINGEVYVFENIKLATFQGCITAYMSEGTFITIYKAQNEEEIEELAEREKKYEEMNVVSKKIDEPIVKTKDKRIKEDDRLRKCKIADIGPVGMYVIRARIKICMHKGNLYGIIADGIDILWCRVLNRDAKEGTTDWCWALVYSEVARGVGNILVEHTADSDTARKWMQSLTKNEYNNDKLKNE